MNDEQKSGNEVLTVKDISMEFSGVKALQNVSFEVRRGEVFGLIGPNGSGKTTSLNVITGTYKPTNGNIYLNGRDITKVSIRSRVRQGISRTFQSVRTFERLSVLDNIRVSAMASGLSKKQATFDATGFVEKFGLSEYRDLPCASVPAGLLRNVGVARAVASRPRFILLDEPAAGQNETEVQALVTQIKQLAKKENLGVVLVEHDMTVVMASCDRLHVLEHGQTELTGTPEAVQSNPRIREIYFGKREVNTHA